MQINKTLSSVVNGCFNNKDAHSVGFVVRWLNEHCHRLIFPVHRCGRAGRNGGSLARAGLASE